MGVGVHTHVFKHNKTIIRWDGVVISYYTLAHAVLFWTYNFYSGILYTDVRTAGMYGILGIHTQTQHYTLFKHT